MPEAQEVDVGRVVDEAPMGVLQIRVAAISAFIVMIDGFDTLCMGFVAPALAAELVRPVASLGPLFAAGLSGLVVGSIVISPLADRMGRKKLLIASLLIFGLFSLAPVVDLNFERLILYRFITGIGLGTAMPCVISLTTEYAPLRQKAFLTNLMFIGFPVGGALGGTLAANLIGQYGWQSVFLLGGILPLIMIPVVVAALPESVAFLAARQGNAATVARVLSRLNPAGNYRSSDKFLLREEEARAGRLRDLFAEGRQAGTLLIWIVLFCTLLVLFNLASWLPAVMQQVGASPEQSVRGPVMMLAGGVCGGVLFGIVIDKIGAPFFLAVTYSIGAIFTALIGLSLGYDAFTLLIIFVTGICVNGGQLSMNGFTARFYPTNIRSTGVGWALGIGRLGAAIGPVLGGMMLSAHWTLFQVFTVIAGASAIAAVCMLTIGLIYSRQPHGTASAMPTVVTPR